MLQQVSAASACCSCRWSLCFVGSQRQSPVSQSLYGGMCVVVLLYSWRAAYLRVSITNPGSTGLQEMTDTVRKLEHQPKSDGHLLTPEHDGELLQCTATDCHRCRCPEVLPQRKGGAQHSHRSAAKAQRQHGGACKSKMVCVKSCQKLRLPQG